MFGTNFCRSNNLLTLVDGKLSLCHEKRCPVRFCFPACCKKQKKPGCFLFSFPLVNWQPIIDGLCEFFPHKRFPWFSPGFIILLSIPWQHWLLPNEVLYFAGLPRKPSMWNHPKVLGCGRIAIWTQAARSYSLGELSSSCDTDQRAAEINGI